MNGEIVKFYEVVCGDCYAIEHGHRNKREFEIKLRDWGWRKTVRLGWACSDCAKKTRALNTPAMTEG